MAWRCTGATNAELINNLAKHHIIHSERIQAAMTKVDRAHYIRNKWEAYEDAPQPIGYGATISAPHMHAHALQNLQPYLRPGARVLDVGSGSGYLCAVIHQLVTDEEHNKLGTVVGIEHIPELTEWSIENLRRDGLGKAIDSGHLQMVAGDGRKGYPPVAPYDAIHVGAASPTMPYTLVAQLASPGRMFIPVGTEMQQIIQVDKDENGEVTEKELFDVMYVPLTDKDKQYY
ncbi:Pcmt1-prov protein [Laetiporus sulphureus 93-53]|uniref:Protein-L-isoaspartate O-methyltransferase n=1 Tax=Laetiporus sulphureus 93-53 TaxID=1314785 RepID=A0A165EI34_9APHY|nr:Pcmt1-prov protein [Laetiporus sulphureus 93-53]KZT07095.1 Pcmt1-prov protein [Laetiporus sulphureus 93-53]